MNAGLYGGPAVAKGGGQPRRHNWSGGTICGAANGPRGPAVAAINGPGDQFRGDQL